MKAGITTTRPSHSWPFMVAPTHHDLQVSPEGVGVPGRQHVIFKDGEGLWLTRVMVDGAPSLYLRELGEPAAGKRIDLRQLIAGVEKELPTTCTRDVAYFVGRCLRTQYATREQFLDIAAPGWRQA